VSDPGTDLGVFAGGARSFGQAINDAGQVAGYAEYAPPSPPDFTGPTRAFRTTATGLVSDHGADLGTLRCSQSRALAINTLGVVVGDSETPAGPNDVHAFIYDTQMRDLNSLIPPGSGWVLQFAWGINDAGQITGTGIFGGQTHAFRLTPVPEPGGLLLAGAAAFVWASRRCSRTCRSVSDATMRIRRN
jgi:probable HAF family extracellular repeat protein